MRAYLVAITLLALILGPLAAWWYAGRDTSGGFQAPPVTVGAAEARLEAWERRLEGVGTVRAARGAEIAAETAGRVLEVHVRSGQDVSAGQQLLTIDDRAEAAAREGLQAELELARVLYERDERLFRQNSIPENRLDQSRADLRSAEARLAEAEARLANRRLRAPFAGTLGIVSVRPGDYLDSGDRITTLQDLSRLEVDFTLPGRFAPLLAPGQEVSVETAAFPGRRFSAFIDAIDTRVDARSRNLLLRARLRDSTGLLPGMFTRLEVAVGEPLAQVTVPEIAVSYSLQGNLVYRVAQRGDDRVAEPLRVVTGDTREGRVAIVDGLEAGTLVVTAGQNKLYPGARLIIDDSVQF